MNDLTRDLTLVPTDELPPQYAHVRFPATEYKQYQRMVRAGEVLPAGSIQFHGGLYFTTVRRDPQHRMPAPARPWVKPLLSVAGGTVLVFGFVWGVTALVGYLVRSFTDAVSQAAPAVGGFVAVSLALLGLVAATRGRRRTFSGTFHGTIR